MKDAAFANAQNNQSDFRIHNNVYVRRVALRKGIEAITVTPIDSIDVANQVFLSRRDSPGKKQLKVYADGKNVQVHLDEKYLGSDIFVYNVSGKVLHYETADQTRKILDIQLNSGIYIITVRTASFTVNEKVVL